jgi:predicted Zn-dependent peptidase
MVEHLAFRGTAMYDTFEVVRFLEAIGARFGPCQNAYTSFDETVYFLKVPIDKGGLLEQALTVLREWAFHVRCSDEDIEAERGIVMEEWRQVRPSVDHGPRPGVWIMGVFWSGWWVESNICDVVELVF